ncbi:MAG: hypothetical protein K2N06_03680 [Oscillospiraceae bacterium]|nr:hypothetical protein [Oscillospiraceae bacterium]
MRNFFNFVKATAKSVKAKVCGFAARVRSRFRMRTAQTRLLLATNRAENFVDSGVKILIAVVIGALLLGGLYALFGETIMPTVTQKVKDMFDFNG